ncbi:MAG: hypothetical protein QS98_C0001G0003 [archaeon GW2011_AR3]|nr:MAG: hypothetical protein QS98_C0001G0003 [archaeon GW2011_AR3]MBS3109281.1 hypothetical protein [Candidatus Woesearchaeota archaeon]
MATILDTGLLNKFSFLFSMLLIIVLVYGILEYINLFKDRQGLHILVAFLIGITLLLVPSVNTVISTITPWFVLMFIFILLMVIAYKMLGATDSDIKDAMIHNKSIVYWIMIFSVIILLGGLGTVFFSGGEHNVGVTVNGTQANVDGDVGETGTSALFATIFHPKVLGLIFLMLIGVFTITTLSSKVKLD